MLSKVYKTRVWIMLLLLVPFIGYAQPAGWGFTLNPTWATYTITTGVAFDGVDDLAPGDWIGVFYEDAGELYCAGYVQWSGSENVAITAFGNDDLEPEKNGFADGELIQWKFYYQADQLEVCVKAFDQGGNEFNWAHGNLGEVVTFAPCEILEDILTINYAAGWNWISFNTLPENPIVSEVLANYPANDLDEIKTQIGGGSVFYAGFGWFPDITINPDYMYALNSAGSGSFDVVGFNVDVTDPIDYVTGWNWIAYKPQNPLIVSVALQNFPASDLDEIKTQGAGAIFYDGFGWFPDFIMEESRGYKMKSSSVAGSFAYPN